MTSREQTIFEEAIGHVLFMEGGYVNDKYDPGGETKYGISKNAYPDLDIPNITFDDALEIYKADYWDYCRCSELPIKVAVLLLDTAINMGAVTAIRILQKSCDEVRDGIIGPKTIAAVKNADVYNLIAKFCTVRIQTYIDQDTFSRFGNGWISRVIQTVQFAMDLDTDLG